MLHKTSRELHQGKTHFTMESLLSKKPRLSISKIINQKIPSWLRQYLSKKVSKVVLSNLLISLSYLNRNCFPTKLIRNIVVIIFYSVQDSYEEQELWITGLDWVGIRLNQFEMFEEHENCLSRWKQCCSSWKQCFMKNMYK